VWREITNTVVGFWFYRDQHFVFETHLAFNKYFISPIFVKQSACDFDKRFKTDVSRQSYMCMYTKSNDFRTQLTETAANWHPEIVDVAYYQSVECASFDTDNCSMLIMELGSNSKSLRTLKTPRFEFIKTHNLAAAEMARNFVSPQSVNT
jgi:hypothetical protein